MSGRVTGMEMVLFWPGIVWVVELATLFLGRSDERRAFQVWAYGRPSAVDRAHVVAIARHLIRLSVVTCCVIVIATGALAWQHRDDAIVAWATGLVVLAVFDPIAPIYRGLRALRRLPRAGDLSATDRDVFLATADRTLLAWMPVRPGAALRVIERLVPKATARLRRP
jgi:hypothetical protein